MTANAAFDEKDFLNTRLARITKQIKTLEKLTIQTAIKIGKLLNEAEEQCEHGEYMVWLETEFDFSYSTSLNYRNAYAFSQKHNSYDYGKLNISLGAFYLLAAMGDDEKAASSAIIKAAKKRRVSRSTAEDIINAFNEPPPIEPLDDDDDDDSDDETSDDEAHDDDDTPPNELITAVNNVMLPYWLRSDTWPKVIKAIGPVKFREFIAALQAVYDKHCETSVVKSAADRAEAKTTKKMVH
jgi:hypothetical protein